MRRLALFLAALCLISVWVPVPGGSDRLVQSQRRVNIREMGAIKMFQKTVIELVTPYVKLEQGNRQAEHYRQQGRQGKTDHRQGDCGGTGQTGR